MSAAQPNETQRIEGRLGLQVGVIHGRQVEGGEFGHLVRGGIVDAADEPANMAHGVLLDVYSSRMLPQVMVTANDNVCQRLFALTGIAPPTLDGAGGIGSAGTVRTVREGVNTG